MLTTRCDGVTRRDFVKVGSLTALGLSLPAFLRRRAAADDKKLPVRAKSCILVWLDGGPSHLETFDPKPNAPVEVRGPLGTIATRIPGVQLSDCLPSVAGMLDRVAVIRSITSPLGEHNLGAVYMLTGYQPTPVLEYPTLGAMVARVRGQSDALPANIAIPSFSVGGGRITGQGYLPATCRPFSVGGDPAKPDFRVRDLDAFPEVTEERLARRRQFVQALDGFARGADTSENAGDPQFEQAYRLVTSPEARRAFALSDEKPKTRERYGPRTIGQSCLLARRLVERGVPFVTVTNVGWDTHQNLYTRLKEGYTGAKVGVGLVPLMDQAVSALLDDLSERGLLDETLVVVMGEFGRTPKLNTDAGRDHWPRAFSVMLAGGGVKRGIVLGESDSVGESPKERPVTPADLACTIYTLLGIDPALELHTADGRPVRVNQHGKVVEEIVA
ncbi:MAG: DUF1501 domain-containing protein [Planctomycetia bacterium]|nr:DUF1501 domain-containing protein [Planctomycetia bacterium]